MSLWDEPVPWDDFEEATSEPHPLPACRICGEECSWAERMATGTWQDLEVLVTCVKRLLKSKKVGQERTYD